MLILVHPSAPKLWWSWGESNPRPETRKLALSTGLESDWFQSAIGSALAKLHPHPAYNLPGRWNS